MKRSRKRFLLSYREAAEMLKLSVSEVKWFVGTGQLFEVRIRGKKRLDRRDLVRVKRFCERAQKWKEAQGRKSPAVSGR